MRVILDILVALAVIGIAALFVAPEQLEALLGFSGLLSSLEELWGALPIGLLTAVGIAAALGVAIWLYLRPKQSGAGSASTTHRTSLMRRLPIIALLVVIAGVFPAWKYVIQPAHERLLTHYEESWLFQLLGDTLAAAAPLLVLSIGFPIIWLMCRPLRDRVNSDRRNKVARRERVGLFLDPIRVAYLRWVLSIIAAIISSAYLTYVIWVYSGYVLNEFFVLGACLATFWLFFSGESEQLRVQEGRIAILTFFGILVRVYLVAGIYPWLGRFMGFSRAIVTDKKLLVSDENGFLRANRVQIPIWNNANERDNIIIESHAKTGGLIKSTLTVSARVYDYIPWLINDDPLLEVSDGTRNAFRDAIAFFVPLDLTGVSNALGAIMSGQTFITAFLREKYKSYREESVIRDIGGEPLFELVTQHDAEAKVREREQELEARIRRSVEPAMLNLVLDAHGNIIVERRTVRESVERVFLDNGAAIEATAVGNISLSQSLTKAMNDADAQPYEENTMVSSAFAGRLAYDQLTGGLDLSDPLTTQILGMLLASDPGNTGNVRHLSLSGGNELQQAAATLAGLQNSNRQ